MFHRTRRTQRRAAATVEFALVASILFMFVLAAIEFGRANMIRGTIGNAAYEGARVAIVPGATAADAKAAAQALIDTALIRSAAVTISPAVLSASTTDVTVTVSVDLNANGWLLLPVFTRGMQLTKSRTLAREEYTQNVAADSSTLSSWDAGHDHTLKGDAGVTSTGWGWW